MNHLISDFFKPLSDEIPQKDQNVIIHDDLPQIS
jgi:hypothetical protein